MNRKMVLASLLPLLTLVYALQVAQAATIPTASLDKTTYLAGQTGYISVSIYNDENENIRVTELTATINYYYADSTPYVQKFFTSATLPDEIAAGQTETYIIPISLPINIAHGYTNPVVEARTDLWNAQAGEWRSSDRPNYTVKLYIESPYKELYGTSQSELESSVQQLLEERAANTNLTNVVYVLAIVSVVFAATAAFLMYLMFGKRLRPVPQQ